MHAAGVAAPVYQCRKALRRNMAVNCCDTRWNISWMAVELPTNVAAILRPLGGMSQMDDLTLFGIHSTKYDEFLFCTFSICSSTCASRCTLSCVVMHCVSPLKFTQDPTYACLLSLGMHWGSRGDLEMQLATHKRTPRMQAKSTWNVTLQE